MAFPVHAITTEPMAKTMLSQAKALWPFLTGFAVSGAIFFNIALGVTEFTNPNQGH